MLQGHQTWVFKNKPRIQSAATIVGPFEGRGPLANDFDVIAEDSRLEQESWEKAERKFMEKAAFTAIEKAGLTKEQIHFYIGGDLMNQIVSSNFAARTLGIPFIGIFGACSNSMESLALASLLVDSGSAQYVLAGTSSHNSSAEKQFRYPTEYGSQKPPTAQYTVTGAGAAIVSNQGSGPIITAATIGRIVDMGIQDPFNMGAAMAPAAVDTIEAHLRDLGIDPGYYDLIATGDLAKVGYDIANELLQQHQIPMQDTQFVDCGMMIYDYENQMVQAGGSGCACSAVVTYGHILNRMKKGELNRVLIVATGALLSPITYQQGESIPCIAHAVAIENGGDMTI